jgi:hypothetical protein
LYQHLPDPVFGNAVAKLLLSVFQGLFLVVPEHVCDVASPGVVDRASLDHTEGLYDCFLNLSYHLLAPKPLVEYKSFPYQAAGWNQALVDSGLW